MLEPLPPRYSEARLLGEGSFGTVYLARDTLLDRLVAVKILRAELTLDASARSRFVREVRTAALLGIHPHVVTLHDAGEWRGRPYLVMEPLEDHVRSGAPEHVALRWLAQAAAALDFVHGLGIVHRDVKPANLLLDAYGDVRLSDFGVARGGTLSALTEDGAVVGTPGYLAPEVARGGVATAASDRYSLAMVARELLGDRAELLPSLSERPEERPATAAAVVAALGGKDAETRVLMPNARTITRIPRTKIASPVAHPRRRVARRGAGVVAIALVAALSAAGGAFFEGRLGAAGRVKAALHTPKPRQTCALSTFDHNANVVVVGVGAVQFCRTEAHALRLEGDQWNYRLGSELLAPDHGSGALTTVCDLAHRSLRLRVYDSGGRRIGGDVCRWYTSGGWRSA